ncbi:MAG: hypothetical protein RRA35_14025, partial [Desulfomonilia bacterium]|nr:hypothetical protein [Desulfomonilia bacterium]
MKKGAWYGLFFVLLSVLVFGVYFNILDNEPTNWDDPALFTRSAIHTVTIENLKTVLSVSRSSTYQPIRDLSYMIDFALFKDNVVFGMHM